ncbi:pentapeptide repeat-containing protein [Streptomyces natalensis]|uniref:pentapeptide repeat-containing protein n=1 Tax=Streptomyces natalensis TaxID=68242 RepID=UPI00099C70D1
MKATADGVRRGVGIVGQHAPAPNTRSPHERLRRTRRRLRAATSAVARGRRRGVIQVALSQTSEPVQAALTVLGRRPRDRDEPFVLQLHRTDLRGAILADAHLEAASLAHARLEGAILIGARLDGAYLGGAHLE